MMEILRSDDGLAPVFRITPGPPGTPPVEAASANKAWAALYACDPASLSKALQKGGQAFGLTHDRVRSVLQQLPGAERCERYCNWLGDGGGAGGSAPGGAPPACLPPPPPLTQEEEAARLAIRTRQLRLPDGITPVGPPPGTTHVSRPVVGMCWPTARQHTGAADGSEALALISTRHLARCCFILPVSIPDGDVVHHLWMRPSLAWRFHPACFFLHLTPTRHALLRPRFPPPPTLPLPSPVPQAVRCLAARAAPSPAAATSAARTPSATAPTYSSATRAGCWCTWTATESHSRPTAAPGSASCAASSRWAWRRRRPARCARSPAAR